MKRIVMLGAMMWSALVAWGATAGNLEYEDFFGCILITGVTDTSVTEIVVPETIDGKKVVCLSEGCFQNLTSLTKVTLPKTMGFMENRAFYGCSALKEIDFLAEDPLLMALDDEIFVGCTSLPVENGIRYSGSDKTIVVGTEGTLSGEVTIPEGVRYLYGSFSSQTGITSFSLPETLKYIHHNVFPSLNHGGYERADNPKVLLSYSGNATSFTVPSTVRFIADGGGFQWNTTLSSITLPEGLRSIGHWTFGNMTALKSIEIPDSVIYLHPNAFNGCTALESVKLPKSLTKIAEGAFRNCTALSSVTWPSALEGTEHLFPDINKYAFSNTALKKVVIPEGFKEIGNESFAYNNHLVELTFSDGVVDVSSGCIKNCPNIKCVIFLCAPYEQDEKVFGGVFSNHLMGYYTTKYATEWQTAMANDGDGDELCWLDLPMLPMSGMTDDGLLYTEGETAITISNYIGSSETLTIPPSINGKPVTAIADAAFSGCTMLGTIEIPASVTSIGEWLAFDVGGISYKVDAANTHYQSIDGALLTKDGKTLLAGTGTVSHYRVPDGVEVIRDGAFTRYHTLKTVTLPESLRTIGEDAFKECTALTTVTCAERGLVEIQAYAFNDCAALTSINFPKTLETIGEYAFCETGLQVITLPATVKTLGGSAFRECDSLKTVAFLGEPPTVTGSYLFNSCDAGPVGIYTSTHAEKWTGVIVENRWQELTMSSQANILDTNERFEVNGITYRRESPANDLNKAWQISSQEPFEAQSGDITHNETTQLIGTVTGMGTLSFSWKVSSERNCDYLRFYIDGQLQQQISGEQGWTTVSFEITTADTHTLTWTYSKDGSVDNGSDCGWIKEILWEAAASADGYYYQVTPQGAILFGIADSAQATMLVLPESINGHSIVEIRANAFKNCDKLKEVTIPGTVKTIGNEAFRECDALTKVTLEEGIETIGNHVFTLCKQLSTVTLPNTLTTIGEDAFNTCTSLTSIVIPESVTTILRAAFCWCENLEQVEIKGPIAVINDQTFIGCTKLRTINIPQTVTAINYQAFQNCDALKEVTLPSTVTSIGHEAFYNCDNLATLDLGDGLTTLGAEVFRECPKLTLLTIGKSFVGDFTVEHFWGTDEVSITVDEENPRWKSDNGALIDTLTNTLFYARAVSGEYIIPEGITSIFESAFWSCEALTSVRLPTILTSLGDGAFHNCDGLTSVNIPEGVITIGEYTFYDCDALKEVTLPSTVTSIARYAFEYCGAIEKLTILSTNVSYPQWDAFYGVNPKELTASHRPQDMGVGNLEKVTLIDGTTAIANNMFNGASKLKEIGIPESVTSVGTGAFSGCTSLPVDETTGVRYESANQIVLIKAPATLPEGFAIPESVRFVCDGAFADCTNLPTVDGVQYESAINPKVLVKAPTTLEGVYTIPETVETIAAHAFDGCNLLTSIVVPEGVTVIQEGAFKNCTELISVTLPSTLTSIGADAFTGCEKVAILTTPFLPDSLSRSALKTVTFHEGLTSLGTEFQNCTLLTSVKLPESLTSLAGNAFDGCTELPIDEATGVRYETLDNPKVLIQATDKTIAGVDIPETVRFICNAAFKDCTLLTEVAFPATMSGIGNEAFRNCDALTLIDIPEGVTTIGEYAFYDCDALKDVTLPLTVTSIARYAFRDCSALTSIGIPEGVTTIGEYAFYDCDVLKEVTLPSTVTSISRYAFAYCSALTSIVLPEGVTTIGEYTFYDCDALKEVTIPSTVTSIARYAFEYCSAIEKLTILSTNVSYPEWSAFYDVYPKELTASHIPQEMGVGNLEKVTLIEGTSVIAENAFNSATKLAEVVIPDTVTSIGSGAFMQCYALQLTLPESITCIQWDDEDCLWNSNKSALIYVPPTLERLVLPDFMTTIPDSLFSGNNHLKEIVLPSTVTTIGNSAFYNCDALTSIEIPEGVTTIGECTFYDCDGLKEVTLPSTVTSIGYEAFEYCSAIEKLTILSTNISYSSYAFSGVNPKELTASHIPQNMGKGNLEKVTLIEGTTAIANNMFNGASKLTEIVIPNSVTSIGTNAFSGCTSLTALEIESNITSIGVGAFANCPNLSLTVAQGHSVYLVDSNGIVSRKDETEVAYVPPTVERLVLPAKMTTIPEGAFRGYTQLKEVVIPEGVTAIGNSAFEGCTALETIEFPSTLQTIVNYAFKNCDALTKVTIPGSVKTIGNEAFRECGALTKITLEEGVETIGDYAFDNCKKLESVFFPSTLQTIGNYAFNECDGLVEVNVPESVTSIGTFAFAKCDNLERVKLPDGLETLSDWTFDICPKLTTINFPSALKTIGKNVFYNCDALTAIELPEGVTTIGQLAFYDCNALREVTIPATVTRIDQEAFACCSAIEKLTIWSTNVSYWRWDAFYGVNPKVLTASHRPQNMGMGNLVTVTVLGETLSSSFLAGLTNLQTVILTESVTSIGNNAFNGCSSLTALEIGANVTSIGTGVFTNCPKLTLTVAEGHSVYQVEDNGIVSRQDGTSMAYVPSSVERLVIPETMTAIPARLCYEHTNLKEVVFHNGVTSIDNEAFYNCDSLISINIPEGVATIGGRAFYDCDALKEVTIPSTVTSIGAYAFNSCGAIEKLMMFALNPTYEKDDYYYSSGYAFSGVNPKELTAAHRPQSMGVGNLEKVAIIGDNIPDGMLSGASKLTEVVIPNTVTSIGTNAFANCSSLMAIQMPSSVETFGDSVFNGCTTLKAVTFVGDAPTTMGSNAFGAEGICLEYPQTEAASWDALFAEGGTLATYLPCKYDVLDELFIYHLTENGVLLRGLRKNVVALEIPTTLYGRPIIGIVDGAFNNASALKLVTFVGEPPATIGSNLFATDTSITIEYPTASATQWEALFAEGGTFSGIASSPYGDGIESDEQFVYTATEEKVTITGLRYLPVDGVLEIPATINELPVAIGAYAFANITEITTVMLPITVTEIADTAFTGAAPTTLIASHLPGGISKTKLQTLIIPEDVTTIGEYAFYDCNALKEVTISSTVTSIAYRAFCECSAIEKLTILSPNVTYSGYYAFSGVNPKELTASHRPQDMGVDNLEKVTIVGTTIPSEMLNGASKLTEVIIPESVTSIDSQAFNGCTALTSFEIPLHITTLGNGIFTNCPNLILSVADGHTNFKVREDGILTSTNESTWYYVPYMTEMIELPKTMTVIPNYLFKGVRLNTLVLPEGVTTIGEYAFYGCNALKEVILPESVTSIGYEAFRDCSAIEKLTILSINVGYGSWGAFYDVNPKELTASHVPQEMGKGNLEKVTLIEGATTIAEEAFYQCSKLKEVTIPSTVTSIARYAFRDCSAIEKLTILSLNVNYPGYQAFYGVSPKELTASHIPQRMGVVNLEKVILLEGTTAITNDMFNGASKLAEISIPNSVTSIGNNAFLGCTLLETIEIGTNITSIGTGAFANCQNLALTVAEGHTIYQVEDNGILSQKDGTSIVYVPASMERLVIPESMTEIPANLCYGNRNLKEVVFHDGVTSIGYSAFYGCTGLTFLSFPTGLVLIDNYTFYNCDSLTSINIPEGVTSIGQKAFYDCNALKEVTISSTVTSISWYAFQYCSAIEKLTILSLNVNYPGYQAFYGVSPKELTASHRPQDMGVGNLEKVTLLDGTTAITNNMFNGASKLKEISIPESVTSVGTGAFSGCTSLPVDETTGVQYESANQIVLIKAPETLPEGFSIPESVRFVCENAFSECTNLPTVGGVQYESLINPKVLVKAPTTLEGEYTIPETVETIAANAFEGCNLLTSIVVPEGVTVIQEGAFKNCTELVSVTLPSTLTFIGANAFTGCEKVATLTTPFLPDSLSRGALTTVTFHEGLTSLGTEFRNCTLLTSVKLPESLTSLAGNAFDGCTELPIDEATGVRYETLDNPKVLIQATDKTIAAIDIPETVRFIYNTAFKNCDALTEVTIPGSVKTIGNEAFRECDALTKVTLEEGVESIGNSVFTLCKQLSSVTLPNTLTTIGEDAFNTCTSLTSIVIPEGVTTMMRAAFCWCENLEQVEIKGPITVINNQTFIGCTRLKTINIPEGVTSINYEAFKNCDTLISVNIPEGVTTIGDYAFYDCDGLKEVTIPSTVTSISRYAFAYCSALTSLGIPEGVTTIGEYAFYDCDALTELIISEGVTSIGEYAFYDCDGLKEVILPSTVTSIPRYAFASCSALTSIGIPEGVTTIGEYAFQSCGALKEVMLPSTLTSIGDGAFYNCDGLTSINIPEGVTTIGDYTFYDCNALKEVTIPSTVTSISRYAFAYCTALTSIVIPEGVTIIGDNAFSNCDSFTSINIPEGVTTIGDSAFYDCDALKVVTLPSTVTVIESFAFGYCSAIEKLTILSTNISYGSHAFYGVNPKELTASHIPPWMGVGNLEKVTLINGTTTITNDMFNGASKLTEISIPNSVTSIGNSAFNGCALLTNIVVPESVTSIGTNAFSGCSSLTALEIGTNVTSIGTGVFTNCPKLTLTVAEGHTIYQVEDNGIVSRKDGTSMVYVPSSVERLVIPETMTEIPARLCYGNTNLKEVVFHNGVASIGDSAFYNCDGLTSINIPEGVTIIGGFAFYSCGTLKEVTIPSTVTSIALCAFQYCSAIEKLTILSTNVSYGSAIYDSWGAFYNVNPKELTASHRPQNMGVGNLEKVTIIGDNIPDGMLSGASKLTEVVIPDTVTAIGTNAFANCSSLMAIQIPDAIETFGDSVFNGCVKLKAVTFVGDAPTAIDSNAFGAEGMYLEYPQTEATSWNVLFEAGGALTSYLPCKYDVLDELFIYHLTENGVLLRGLRKNVVALEIPTTLYGQPVVGIVDGAFNNVSTLKLVTFAGEPPANIGSNLFASNTSITIEYPSVSAEKWSTYFAEGGSLFGVSSVPYGESITIPRDETFVYVLSEEKATITGMRQVPANGELVIPETFNELPVAIGAYAFSNISSITAVTIPLSVIEIGTSAFSGVAPTTLLASRVPNGMSTSKLQTVIFPEDMLSIDGYAFDGIKALKNVYFPTSLKSIGSYAFNECDGLIEVEIPESVTSIGSFAFAKCDNLETVKLPDGLERIENWTFDICPKLTTVNFPSALKTIGRNAFYDCDSLTEIHIPTGVTSIETCAFAECSNLSILSLPTGIITLTNSVFYNCDALVSVNIPTGVTTIDQRAFYDCDTLNSVVIPTGVTTIGREAFYSCDMLKDVTFPSTVTSISSSAFENCPQITKVTVLGMSIPDGLLANLQQLAELSLPNFVGTISLNEIGVYTGLTALQLGAGVTSVDFGIFEQFPNLKVEIAQENQVYASDTYGALYNKSMTTLYHVPVSSTTYTLPESVTSITPGIFDEGTYLVEIEGIFYESAEQRIIVRSTPGLTGEVIIPDTVRFIYHEAFKEQTGIETLTVCPTAITYTGSDAFAGVSPTTLSAASIPQAMGVDKLTTLIIPDGVEELAAGTFTSATALTTLRLPACLTGVENGTFAPVSLVNLTGSFIPADIQTDALSTLIVPEGIVEITEDTFDSLPALTSVHLPVSLEVLPMGAFDGTDKVVFTVEEGNETFSAEAGVLFAGERLLYARTVEGAYVIPEHITTIEAKAFYNAAGLTEVTIPLSVASENVGADAFTGTGVTSLTAAYVLKGMAREALTKVTLPTGMTAVEPEAFKGCTAITSVVIPEGVTSIERAAFAGCTQLASVTFPTTLETIAEDAFKDCPALVKVILHEEVTSIGANAFSGCVALDEVRLPTGVTVDDGAFTGSSPTVLVADALPSGMSREDLESVTLATIPDEFFMDRTNLTSIVIPEGVEEIGARAFKGCSNLTSVMLPSTLKRIGDEAFYDCYGVEVFNVYAGIQEIGARAFTGCKVVTVEEGGDYYQSIDEVLFTAGTSALQLIHFPKNRGGAYTVPRATQIILEEAFMGNTVLQQVTLPKISQVKPRAFKGCTALKSCFFRTALTTIETSAFEATALEVLVVPDSPNLVMSADAFKDCDKLTRVIFQGPPPTVANKTVFSGRAHASRGGWYTEAYAAQWGTQWDALPMSVEGEIEDEEDGWEYFVKNGEAIIFIAPENCAGELVLPETLGGYLVTGIDGPAFFGSDYYGSITSIILPEAISFLGNGAFGDCTALTKLHFLGAPPEVEEGEYNLVPNTSVRGSYTNAYRSDWRKAFRSEPWKNLKWTEEDYVAPTLTVHIVGNGVVAREDLATGIRLTATAYQDAIFLGWSGDLSNTEAIFEVEPPTSDMTLVALFVPKTLLDAYVETYGGPNEEELEAIKQTAIDEARDGIIEEATPGIIEAAREGIIADATPGIIEAAKPGIIAEATPDIEKAAIERETPTIIENAREGIIADATPGIIESAKPGIIEAAKQGIIDEAREGIIEEAKPDIIAEVKQTIVDEAKEGVIDEAIVEAAKPTIIEQAVTAKEIVKMETLKEISLTEPIIEVKDKTVTVAISLKSSEELGKWQTLLPEETTAEVDKDSGLVRVILKIPEGSNAAFYQFAVDEEKNPL